MPNVTKLGLYNVTKLQGCNQRLGSDYERTFAQVVKLTPMCAFLAESTYKQMHMKHVDMKTAFPYSELK